MERIASYTKQPAMLRELFEALGNDPFLIAECLARPVLAERLLTNLNAHYRVFTASLRCSRNIGGPTRTTAHHIAWQRQVLATGFPLSRIGRMYAPTKRGQSSAPPMHLHGEPPTQRCGLGVR